MNNKHSFLIFFLFGFYSFAFGQNEFSFTKSDNLVIKRLTSKVEKEGWLTFKKSAKVRPNQLFSDHKAAMGLGNDDDMRERKRFTDALGIMVIKTQQFYKGIPVLGTDFYLHSKSDKLELAHGKLVEKINIDAGRIISESSALARALEGVNATKYAWQDTLWERGLKQDLNRTDATYFPKGNLVIAPLKEKNYEAKNYALCYVFEVLAVVPHKQVFVYIDAKNGRLVKVINAEICNSQHHHDNHLKGENLPKKGDILQYSPFQKNNNAFSECRPRTGTCTTFFNGNQNFTTNNRWFYGDFILEDCTRGDLLHTKIHKAQDNFWWADQVTDGDNDWGSVSDPSATSGHWALQKSWDFFQSTFTRNGMDDTGDDVRLFVDWEFPIEEKTVGSFNRLSGHYIIKTSFNFDLVGSNAAGTIPWVTLDNIGHEFTHGVIHAEANMGSSSGFDEFKALNESFADIFGEMIEQFVTGSTDLINGAQIRGLRNLRNPNLSLAPQPLTFQGTNWDFNNAAHTNSGVQNRWFVLLSDQIGFEKASKITYRNITHHLTVNTQYADARIGSIQAAISLFGECSNEVRQTKNAWAAVGVGSADNSICVSVSAPNLVCSDIAGNLPTDVSLQTNPTTATVSWNIPSGMDATINGKTLTINSVSNPGIFVITATASASGFTDKTVEIPITFNNCNDCPPNGLPCVVQLKGNSSASNVGSNKVNQDILHVYPNPSSSILTIEMPKTWRSGSIVLLDVLGNALKQVNTHGENQVKLDISTFANGLYFIEGVSEDGFHQVQKIRIAH